MSYQHDIFISYRRHPETMKWIEDHFIPLLELRLEFELGRKPTIFLDNQLEAGASLPPTLGAALGASRVLIALWTGHYLASTWCTREFSHMLAREKEEQLRTVSKPHGLVIPVFLHDGYQFPAELDIKPLEFHKYFNTRMARDSRRAEELADAIGDHAAAIAHCINNAPVWRPAWPQQAADDLFAHLLKEPPTQTTAPGFTGGA